LHISLRDSFLFTGLPWLIAGCAGLLIGGLLVDALVKAGKPGARRVVLMVGTACGLALVGAAFAHSATAALLPISIAIGGLSAASPVLWSLPSLLVPNSSTGKVGGIMNFSNQISAIAAPILTGYVVQATGHFFWAFVLAAVYVVLGVLSYAFLLGPIVPLQVKDVA
jgi:MFS transporter, ACS family, D-galactonate transporter